MYFPNETYYKPTLIVINPFTNATVNENLSSAGSPLPFATDVFVYNYSSASTLLNESRLDGTVLVTNYFNSSLNVIPDFQNPSQNYNLAGKLDGKPEFANPIDITINPYNGSIFVLNNANSKFNAPLNTQLHYLPVLPMMANPLLLIADTYLYLAMNMF